MVRQAVERTPARETHPKMILSLPLTLKLAFSEVSFCTQIAPGFISTYTHSRGPSLSRARTPCSIHSFFVTQKLSCDFMMSAKTAL